MTTVIIEAKNYKNREDLDAQVVNLFGRSVENKICLIKGKKSELETLHLDDRSTVWGCKVEITDEPTIDKQTHKISRGEQFNSGLNLNV